MIYHMYTIYEVKTTKKLMMKFMTSFFLFFNHRCSSKIFFFFFFFFDLVLIKARNFKQYKNLNVLLS